MDLSEQQIIDLLNLGSQDWGQDNSYREFLVHTVEKYGFPYVLNNVSYWLNTEPSVKTAQALKRFLHTT